MSKIEKKLKQQSESNQENEFQVIVTGFIHPERAEKFGLKPFSGLDNIYSGSLTGANILELGDIETVESVEPDGTVEILDDSL